MPINYPVRSEGRAAFRRVVEAIAQEIPITGALAHLYGYTHPSEFEQALEEFHKAIAASVNDHDARPGRSVEDDARAYHHAREGVLIHFPSPARPCTGRGFRLDQHTLNGDGYTA
jgi:hypothetical protein